MSDTDSTRTVPLGRWLVVTSCLMFCAAEARAEAYDSAGAEVLFREGKQLMDQKNYAAACPKLAESYHLDPATGSLLALALCYERAGKLASAWVAYTDAAARAKREGQEDREQGARARARELEPKLARLVVNVEAPDTPGLVVTRDGVQFGSAALGTAIPIDHGQHVVEARAPGREPFREVIEASDTQELTVLVPELAPTRTESAKVEPLPPVSSDGNDTGPVDAPATSDTSSPLSTAGIVVAVVGAVGLAVGTYYGIRALSLKNEANCSGPCAAGDEYDKQQQAYDAGNISTVAFVAGGVLTGAGLALYLVGAPEDSGAASSAPSGYGVLVSGRF